MNDNFENQQNQFLNDCNKHKQNGLFRNDEKTK